MVSHTHTQKRNPSKGQKSIFFSLFENKLNKFQFEIIQVTTYNL
jgi:hypothetical protein